MPFSSLREFVSHLEDSGKLIRINTPVSPNLEITEIQTRVLASKGPALLFENVIKHDGSPYNIAVLTNLFGTVERVAWGMDQTPSSLREIGEALAYLKQPEPPAGWHDAIGMLPILKKAMSMKPKHVNKAASQEIVITGNEIDLTKLPIQTCWPGEPAPLITWPLVVTQGTGHDKRDITNIGIYRMQVISKNSTTMRWLKHRGGAGQYDRWKQTKREPLPAAVVIGADPGMLIAAVTPVPDTMSEYQFAGLLRGKRIELVDCKTIPLKVPAEAEIILEGHIALDDFKEEGPYGDHTGYYNSVEKFPVFTISAITMRKNPIYLSTYTGKPPDEPSVLGEALNEIFIPLLVQQFPEIVDFWLPPEGCSYRIAVVSINKSYPGHAKRIMMGIWSFLRQFIYTKFIIVVDKTINCRDWSEVMWAVSTQMDPDRDLTIIKNTPIDYLDFASPEEGLGSKVGFDATNKIYPETLREWGEPIKMDNETIELVNQKWDTYNIPLDGKPIWENRD